MMKRFYDWMGWCWHDWNRPEPNWTMLDGTYVKRCERCGEVRDAS